MNETMVWFAALHPCLNSGLAGLLNGRLWSWRISTIKQQLHYLWDHVDVCVCVYARECVSVCCRLVDIRVFCFPQWGWWLLLRALIKLKFKKRKWWKYLWVYCRLRLYTCSHVNSFEDSYGGFVFVFLIIVLIDFVYHAVVLQYTT